VQTGQIDTEQEKSESAQETKEREQQQVSDEWYRSPLVDFNERARALAAEKAAQMQQAHYVVAEPRTPVSKISREKTIPVQSVIGLVIISTFPIVRSLLKNVKLKEKKKK